MKKSETGKLGELSAARYLREQGYEILSSNYRTRMGEIDIIAADKKYICFVEVKTRSENSRFSPADAVDISKRKKIILTAEIFLSATRTNLQPRFDIIEVVATNCKIQNINHIKNAFDGDGK